MDSTDREIIRRLRQDRGASQARIARELGLTRATVSARIMRLEGDGIIMQGVLLNPVPAGYAITAHMGLHVDLDRTEQVIRELSAIPTVRSVYRTTGVYDIVIIALFRSSDELLPFLDKRLTGIGGIRGVDASQVLQIAKHAHEWELPDDPEEQPGPHTRRPVSPAADSRPKVNEVRRPEKVGHE